MRYPFKLPAGILLAGGFILLLFQWMLVGALVRQESFKTVLQEQISHYLETPVKVGFVKAAWPNKITASHLEIKDKALALPFEFRLDRIELRYGMIRTLQRDFAHPQTVIFKDPKFVINEDQAPGDILAHIQKEAAESGLHVPVIEIRGAEIEWRLPFMGRTIYFKNTKGQLTVKKNGMAFVKLNTQADVGVLAEVQVEGFLDLMRGTHHLEFYLKAINSKDQIPLSVSPSKGKVVWENDRILIQELKADYKGWKTTLKGKVFGLNGMPKIDIAWGLEKSDQKFQSSFMMDFESSVIKGEVREAPLFQKSFHGTILRDGLRFILQNIKISDGRVGDGEVDLRTGDVRFRFSKEKEDLGFRGNLKGSDMYLDFTLDHVRMYGVDVAAKGEFKIMPSASMIGSELWQFKATFKTDYFSIQQVPFENFHGAFEADTKGIHDFSSWWGGHFKMDGFVTWSQNPVRSKFYLFVNQFDLANVSAFALKPLPADLNGILDGKLEIEGDLNRPAVKGNFSLKGGRAGDFYYDRASIKFEGTPPYLPLIESKIYRGRSKLNLTGALDLSLNNMFSGIEVQTPEKVVLWKGLEIRLNQPQQLGEASPLGALPALPISKNADSGAGAESSELSSSKAYLASSPKVRF